MLEYNRCIPAGTSRIVDELGRTQLHSASTAEIVQTLVNHGINVHVKDKYGCTALHLAAMRGNFAVIEALLEAGANPLDADNHGNTALHNAGQAFICT